ncbi:MAG: class II fructose-bisphosphate aldolase [bacterium]
MEVTLRDILPKAYKEHRVILQFNIHTLEDIVGVIEAVYELDLPVIIACTSDILDKLGGRSVVGVYRSFADYCSAPIVLHLDRAVDLKDIWKAISIGFTSIMIDGSRLSYEDNVRLTSTIIEVARATGISVEGKVVSRINGYEFTDPDLAYSFLLETEIDVLEVAVKSYNKASSLDFERLERINKIVKIPLSLRKDANMPMEDIDKAITLGVAKINVEETLSIVTEAYRETTNLNYNALDIVVEGKNRLKEKVKELILELEKRSGA